MTRYCSACAHTESKHKGDRCRWCPEWDRHKFAAIPPKETPKA